MNDDILFDEDMENNYVLAETFMHNHMYQSAIKCWNYIFYTRKIHNYNVLFRLFDAYIAIFDFGNAKNVINQIPAELHTSMSYVKRISILNTMNNLRHSLKITLCGDFKLISNNNIILKGNEITNYRISLASNCGINVFLASHYDVHYKPKYSIINPLCKKINNKLYIYDFAINLLCISSLSYVEVNSKNPNLIATFDVCEITSVLRGKENWLFLDNDSNGSPLQFIGEKLISNNEIDKWKLFLNSFLSGIDYYRTLFLIAPSKEKAYCQFYPYKRGEITPVDQILSFKNKSILYPLNIVATNEYSYCKTETHWSYSAANTVFLEILKFFGCDITCYKCPYSFKLVDWVGDLGSKVNPVESSYYHMIDNLSIYSELVFSNHIGNTGRIDKYFNSTNCCKKKIVVFGSSSSEQLLYFFTSYFETVVFVWTCGSVVESIIAFEKPDFVVSQTNERFLVVAPSVYKTISEYKPFFKISDDHDFSHLLSLKYIDNEYNGDVYHDYLVDYAKLVVSRFNDHSSNLSKELSLLKDKIRSLGLFNVEYYRQFLEFDTDIDLLEHYLAIGWKLLYNPSNYFNTKYYLDLYTDVKNKGICPLIHYVKYGMNEGRKILP